MTLSHIKYKCILQQRHNEPEGKDHASYSRKYGKKLNTNTRTLIQLKKFTKDNKEINEQENVKKRRYRQTNRKVLRKDKIQEIRKQ